MSIQRFNPVIGANGQPRMALDDGAEYIEYRVFQLLETKHYDAVTELTNALSHAEARVKELEALVLELADHDERRGWDSETISQWIIKARAALKEPK